MPDSLPTLLSPWEREAAANRLWKIIEMIDGHASRSDVREAVKFTALAMEDRVWAKDRPINAEEVAA